MVVWNSEADAKLLVAILKTAKPKIDHDAVAAHMDMNVTGHAVQHRLRRLNALAKGGSASAGATPAKANGNGDDSDPETPTPSPRKRATANVSKPATPGRKRRAPAEVEPKEEGEDFSAKKVKKDDDDCV